MTSPLLYLCGSSLIPGNIIAHYYYLYCGNHVTISRPSTRHKPPVQADEAIVGIDRTPQEAPRNTPHPSGPRIYLLSLQNRAIPVMSDPGYTSRVFAFATCDVQQKSVPTYLPNLPTYLPPQMFPLPCFVCACRQRGVMPGRQGR